MALVVVAFQLPIFDLWFSSMDEGHVLLFADIIAQGGQLHRDATLYPLGGAFYLLALFFEVLGPSIGLSRWIVMIEFALFAALIYGLLRRIVPASAAWAAIGLLLVYRIWAYPHWQVYSYSTTALLTIVLAVTCLLRFLDRAEPGRASHGESTLGRYGWLVAAGLLFGFVSYCKQDLGAATLLAMPFVLLVALLSGPGKGSARPWQALTIFVGSGAIVGAGVGLYFWAHGILPDLIQQTVLNHIRGIGTFEYSTYPSLFPLFEQDPKIRTTAGRWAFFPGIVSTVDLETLRQNYLYQHTAIYDVAVKLFFWVPYPFVLGAALRLWRRRAALASALDRRAFLAELALVSLACTFQLVLTLNRPQDFLHTAVLYWPFLVLSVVYARDLFARHRALAAGLALLALIPSLAVLGYSGRAYARLIEQNSEPLVGERGGVSVAPSEAKLFAETTAFLHEHSAPDEKVAVLPYFPILHFLADRLGPHRSAYIVWPFAEFEDRDAQIIAAMEAERVNAVVFNFAQFPTFPPMREFAPELFAYLVEHFEIAQVFSYHNTGFMLAGLLRQEERADADAGLSLLATGWEQSAVWVESDEGPPRALGSGERFDYARRELWPFRPVLALRPSAGGRRTVFSVPLEVAAGDELRTAIAFHPDVWFMMPAYEARFAISVVAQHGRETLYERTLRPHVEFADRGWFEIELALDRYAGQRVRLELSVAVDSPDGETRLVGGFEEPRVHRVDAIARAVAD